MHSWNINFADAKQLQEQLSAQIITQNQIGSVTTVAGTDVGFEDNGEITRAAVALLRFPDLKLIEYQIHREPTRFPYVPGYLSFRECPAVLGALQKLTHQPDLLLCDGQGIAHPRRFGIACHLGLITGIPSIGVAKSRLTGKHEKVGNKKGDWQPLIDRREAIGAALCTRDNTKPLYISPGHKVSLETSIEFVLKCCGRYKLPETTRWADGIASGKQPIIKKLSV